MLRNVQGTFFGRGPGHLPMDLSNRKSAKYNLPRFKCKYMQKPGFPANTPCKPGDMTQAGFLNFHTSSRFCSVGLSLSLAKHPKALTQPRQGS